jgi:predicted MFS family arabinose efflux permease
VSTLPRAIFALAAINLAIGTQSFVFAGLLSALAQDLGISIGTSGLLVPASSITFAMAAPFATTLVSKIERKRVMVASLAILALCNALCAVAPTFGWLLALRILGSVVTAFAG